MTVIYFLLQEEVRKMRISKDPAERKQEIIETAMRLFYEKALNRVGWNKYSRINVEFDNQIICTRRP